MTTLFKAPQIGEPRSTGVKNGGVTSYDTRIIAPTSRIVGDAVESGKQISFRWRSSSSAFHNPRETKLAVRYKLKFGPLTGAGNALTAVAGGNLSSNVRFTACPNTALFADGCQYQVNSTMVENQPNYYDAAKVKLYTKYDHAADTSGSCGLLTRRKDLHAPTKNTVTYPAGGTDDRDGVSERAEMYNPKQEIIRQSFRTDATESGEIELLDNVWLSSFEHGYFVAGSDHELTLTFAQNFADMFHSQSFVYKGEDAAGNPTTVTQAPYENLVVGKLPADNACTAKTIYCEITDIALHVAMAGTVPSIPPSVALKYSELMIVNRELTQQQNEISLVVPPSTRALYCFSRQQIHDVRADAEELGLAGAGIDEVGLCGAGAGDTACSLLVRASASWAAVTSRSIGVDNVGFFARYACGTQRRKRQSSAGLAVGMSGIWCSATCAWSAACVATVDNTVVCSAINTLSAPLREMRSLAASTFHSIH